MTVAIFLLCFLLLLACLVLSCGGGGVLCCFFSWVGGIKERLFCLQDLGTLTPWLSSEKLQIGCYWQCHIKSNVLQLGTLLIVCTIHTNLQLVPLCQPSLPSFVEMLQ